ncbi:hypothetical protein, partial [Pseudomonas sp. RL_5y_Pfl2_73]|uniref:hypothetical protein n=1 Tax=Pseudomonas sp. RL_5y_Pfl2_73 TaxID=3088713 RepID=UPI0030DC604E
ALLRPEGLKNEENGSNFDAGRFLKSTDGSIAGKHPAISDHPYTTLWRQRQPVFSNFLYHHNFQGIRHATFFDYHCTASGSF